MKNLKEFEVNKAVRHIKTGRIMFVTLHGLAIDDQQYTCEWRGNGRWEMDDFHEDELEALEKSDFRMGDVVVLASGNVPMTIIKLFEADKEIIGVGCVWHDNHGVMHKSKVPVEGLIHQALRIPKS